MNWWDEKKVHEEGSQDVGLVDLSLPCPHITGETRNPIADIKSPAKQMLLQLLFKHSSGSDSDADCLWPQLYSSVCITGTWNQNFVHATEALDCWATPSQKMFFKIEIQEYFLPQ